MASTDPIGIFDSGIGGLTVLKAVQARLAGEALIYLGDTARVPYGTKSADVVQRYAINCARFLVDRGARAIVVACNTASAVAVQAIQDAFSVPVLGVIEPGAALAAKRSASGRIGVIGTEGTIASGRYQAAIAAARAGAEITTTPCPLFVPLAEEGWVDHPATEMIAREYLSPLVDARIDTLVLGCTHYPLLQPLLQRVCGDGVLIINSAEAVAEALASMVTPNGTATPAPRPAFFATDVSQRLRRVGKMFLGDELDPVEWVDL